MNIEKSATKLVQQFKNDIDKFIMKNEKREGWFTHMKKQFYSYFVKGAQN
jgi:hypothetical protein